MGGRAGPTPKRGVARPNPAAVESIKTAGGGKEENLRTTKECVPLWNQHQLLPWRLQEKGHAQVLCMCMKLSNSHATIRSAESVSPTAAPTTLRVEDDAAISSLDFQSCQ